MGEGENMRNMASHPSQRALLSGIRAESSLQSVCNYHYISISSSQCLSWVCDTNFIIFYSTFALFLYFFPINIISLCQKPHCCCKFPPCAINKDILFFSVTRLCGKTFSKPFTVPLFSYIFIFLALHISQHTSVSLSPPLVWTARR